MDKVVLDKADFEFLLTHQTPTLGGREIGIQDAKPFLAYAVKEIAPLFEGEKVLKDWLEQQGVIYGDGAYGLGWGYRVMTKDGVKQRPGAEPFSTYAQCLEWCLDYARKLINTNEHVKTWAAAIDEFQNELTGLGVDPDIVIQAMANMAQRRVDNLNNAKRF